MKKLGNELTKNLQYLCVVGVIALGLMTIVATGGGGGGGDGAGGGSSGSPLKQGIFIDSPVEGVEYETSTQSGITDSEGTFQYEEGEIVKFSIGDILLGQGLAKEIMTPIDLVDGAVDETDPTVTNICRLLLSLDVDANWNNGITISEEIRNECALRSIDFAQSTTDFEDDPDVENLFMTLNALGVFTDGDERTLCSAIQAQGHLSTTLNGIDNDGDGYTENQGDCDDRDSSIYPGADEICDDGIDQDCDGSDLACSESEWRKVRWEYDNDNNGTIDARIYFYYDAMGRLTRQEHFSYTSAGTYKIVSYYTYDVSGKLTEVETDTDNDGTIDVRYYSYYDAIGRLTRQEYFTYTSAGTYKTVIYYTYNVSGKLTEVETDTGNDGTIDVRSYSYYDAIGRLTRQEHFSYTSAGTYKMVSYYTYDSSGRISQITYDSESGIDFIMYYYYDVNGNLKKTATDNLSDGSIDSVTYVYWEKI